MNPCFYRERVLSEPLDERDLKIFKIDPYCKLLHVDYTDVWAKISDILREVGGDFTIFDVDTIIVSWAEEKLKIFGYELRLMNYAKFIS